jgi:3-oxosteroid 1-dehydrogenase
MRWGSWTRVLIAPFPRSNAPTGSRASPGSYADFPYQENTLMSKATHAVESRLRVSRRGFLKASGVGVGAAAAANLGAVPFAASRAAAQQGWDAEHDIVIVGSGGAAFAAAVTAKHLGSDVVMLEKGAYLGGTTLVSGGTLWMPNNSAMREEGLEDPREDAIKYMARHWFPAQYDPDAEQLGLSDHDFAMVSAYYDLSAESSDVIQEAGAQSWLVSGQSGPTGDLIQTDYMAHFQENVAPVGRSINAKDADGNRGNGGTLIQNYQAWAEQNGVEIRLHHRVERVVLNDQGDVIGVEVSVTDPESTATPNPETSDDATPGPVPEGTPELAATPVAPTTQTLAIRARKGVIFGSGGFARNDDMMRHFMQAPYFGGCSAPTNEGDLIRISSAVGAKLGNLHNVWRNEGIYEQAIANSGAYNCVWFYSGDSFLIVNKEGRRFVNEKANYQDRPMPHFDWDANLGVWKNLITYMVYDERVSQNWAGWFPFPEDSATAPYVVSGETLEELAAAIQERVASIPQIVDALGLGEDFTANLVDEVAKFNEYARTGEDLDFQRGAHPYDTDVPYGPVVPEPTIEYPSADQPNVAMYPLSDEGPYYAFIMAASAVDTNGGPVINTAGQILNWSGEPVPGLYGAGNCVATPSVNAYSGAGQTLGHCTIWGYAAAKHAHESQEKAV